MNYLNPASRKSADSAWPLRRADGSTWAGDDPAASSATPRADAQPAPGVEAAAGTGSPR